MDSTKKNIILINEKCSLIDFPLRPIYIALRIILLSSAVSVQGAFGVDLPSVDAGCDTGLTTCNVTGTMGTDFTVIGNINAPGDGINTDNTVAASTFTVNSGISVTGGAGSGFAFGSGIDNTLVNNGTIRGGTYGVYNFGSGFILTNNENSTISAPQTVVEGRTGVNNTTINNAGNITADNGASGVAIRLYGSNNTINLNSTSNIIGGIQFDPFLTNNQIILLGGSSATGTFSSNIIDATSLNSFIVNAPGTLWNITGTVAAIGLIGVQAGDVVLTGDLSTSGTGTVISSGASLQIGNGGTTGSLQSPVDNSGTLIFNRSDELNFNGQIMGTGVVIQQGSGTTILTRVGNWTGGLQVTSGVLNGQLSSTLGNGAVSVTNGAILQLGDINDLQDYLFSPSSLSLDASTLLLKGSQTSAISNATWYFSLATPISLSNSTLDFEQGAGVNLHFQGDINATNTSMLNYVADSGDHTLAMEGSLTGSGNFSVNMQETTPGSMELAFNGTANNYTGSIVLSGDNYTVDVNTLLGQAAWDLTGAQTLNFNGANTHVITGLVANTGSRVNITDANTELQVGSGTVNGIIGGAGNLTKNSTGILSLNGVNTYTGATKIQSGTVNLGVDNSIATSKSVEVDANATLGMRNFSQLLQEISGAGNITMGSGNLTAQSNTNTTFSGKITGTGNLIKTGTGVLTLSGNANSVAGTQVTGGTLQFTQNGIFNATSLLVDSGSIAQIENTAQIASTGNADIEGTLDVSMGGTNPKVTASDATLGAGSVLNVRGYAPAAATKASDITNGPRAVVLQTTTGTITGDFSSVTGVPASGVDYYFNNAAKSADSKSYSVGQVLSWTSGSSLATGNFTLTNASDAFNVDVVLADQAANGSIWDGSSLTKLGAGTLTLSATNTYTGPTTVSAGTLKAGIANAIATSSAVDIASGATLDINGFNQTVQNLTGGGSILLSTGNLTAQNGSDTAFSGPITGTGSLIKTGTGTLSLSSTSSSVGATQVSEGTLLFTQSGAFNAASLLVDSGATAQFDAPSQLIATGNATVNGILNVTLGGVTPMITAADATLGATSVLTVNGFAPITATKASDLNAASSVIIQTTNGISGDFSLVDGISASNVDYVINGGRLSADGKSYSVGSVLTWLAGPTVGNGNFTLTNAGDAFDVDIVLGNQGASATGWDGTTLTKLGAGNLTLSAANTYTGATRVQAGTLTTGIDNAFATSNTVTVASGATLALNNLNQLAQDLNGAGIITLGSGTLTAQNNNDTAFSGTINGTGGLSKTGSGALTLSATGSSVGAAEISAGTLHFAQSGMFNAASLQVDSGTTAQLDANAQVTASGNATIDGILDVTLGGTSPMLTAANATLNTSSSQLNISGFSSGPVAKASDLDGTRTVVIHTTGGITGDFSAVQGVGAGSADYIITDAKKSTDGMDYSVGNSLTWFAGVPLSSGNFTLVNAADAFDVDVALTTQPANGSAWDGNSLTKLGAGTLTLSAANTYTGATTVQGGTLKTGIANAFADSSSVSVNTGATLDLNNFDQLANNLGGSGNIALGSGTLTANMSSSNQLTGVISGSGGLVKEGGGRLAVFGHNTYQGGTQINAGTLSVGVADGLGALTSGVTIDNNAELDVTVAGEFGYGITVGSGGGMLVGVTGMNASGLIDGSGHLTTKGIIDVTGDNTYTGGTTVSNGATFSLGRNSATGSVQGDIINNGILVLNRSNDFTVDGVISGTGSVDGLGTGTATLTGVNTFAGGLNVGRGTVRVTQGGTLGTGAVAIAIPGILQIDAPTGGSYTFDHALTGNGTLKAGLSASTDTFSFGSTVGNAFGGTVALGQGQFSLDGTNTTALTNATLQLDAGNTTTVGATDQNIGGLTLNGGTMAWSGEVPPQSPVGKVNVGDLTLTSGTVQVDVPDTTGIPNPVPAPGVNLLAQDDGDIQSQLVAASGTVSGDVSALGLVDSTGQAVSDPQQLAITEGGTTVANGSYDFMLSTGANNDGLYLGYGLKALDLVNGQILHIAPDSGASSNSAVLNAQVTGSGNLDVNGAAADSQRITLSNAANSYTGITTVSGGTLVAGTDNALGATSQLSLANATGFDLNGKSQTIGTLTGAAGSTLNLNGGNLALSQGGQSDGTLSGEGNLNLTGGTLTVNGANSGLSATVTLTNTVNALLSDVAGLGTGAVNLNGAGTKLQINGASGTLANNISGSGETSVQGGSSVTLGGDNSGFSGDFAIDATSTLTAAQANQLGTARIENGGALVINSATDWTLANAVNGSGSLEKTGSGNLTVNSANLRTGATTVSAGTLTLGNALGAGTGAATIAAPGTLALNFSNGTYSNAITNGGLFTVGGDANQLSGAISGAGINRVSGTNLAITGDNSAFTGNWDLLGGSSTSVTTAPNLGGGTVALNGTLNVAPASGDFAFNNALTGAGLLNVAMGTATDRFSFGSGAGSAYTGTVSLGQGAFTLSALDTSALTNATLQINNANQTLVGAGTQNIGNLTLNGGSTRWDLLTNTQVQTGQLALNGGEVRVDNLTSLPDPSNTIGQPLLEQDDVIGNPLILSQGNTGAAANMTLTDGLGNPLATSNSDIVQNDNVVAVGTYGYGLTGSNLSGSTGLYLYSGLLVMDIQAGQQVTLTQPENAPLGGNEMHARITGSGDLNVVANSVVTLDNPRNDYTGKTTVTSGTLRLGFDHAMGLTSAANLLGTSQIDLNGKTQAIGALNSDAGAVFNLNGGNLTITDAQRAAGDTNGGTVLGRLVGSGQLVVDPSILTVDGANPNLSATTLVTGGSEVRLNNVLGLGTGAVTLDAGNDLLTFDTFNGQTASGDFSNVLNGSGIVQLNSSEVINLAADNSAFNGGFTVGPAATLIASNKANLGSAAITDNGTLQINNADAMTLTNTVTGSGGLVKNGSGTLTVFQPGYSGTTNVNIGTLVVGDGTQTGAKLGADGAGEVTVAQGATLGGNGTVSGSVNNAGTLAALNALTGFSSASAGILTLNGNLINSGLMQLAGGSIGNTLSVAGNYTGGGVLALQTVLGGDNSPTDKLVVGGNTSGTTQVTVKNAGGSGAQTNAGIQVVQVAGQSDGVFSLNGRAVAGAYEYQLVKNSGNGDWYLQSQSTNPPTPPNPPEPPAPPPPTPTPVSPQYRPEPGAYLANQRAAQNMFLQTLYDRAGAARSEQDSDLAKGWVRLTGDYTKQQSNGGLFDEKTHTTMVQVGSDLWQRDGDNGEQFTAGLMAGYGHATSNVSVEGNSNEARGQVNGYSLGAYGTWYQHPDRINGLYVDSWLQHGWYKNHVNGDDLPQESYDSQGTDVSVETGYGFAFAQSEKVNWIVTPQAQLIYSHYETSGHTEDNGTKINANGDDGIRTRVGVRLARNNVQELNTAQPFVEVNWYNGKPSSDSVDFNQVRFENATATNRYEAKIGVNGTINKNWQTFGQVSAITGDNDYRSYQGMIGVKYQW